MSARTAGQAQVYAAHGWPVFPCRPGGKEPATRHGFLDATTDPDLVAWWWKRQPDANVAVATGQPGPDVLDVDQHGEAGSGFAALNRLKRAGLVEGASAIVSTPSGGLHLYFAGSAGRTGAGRADLYQQVTDRITAALEAGTIPWRQPWTTPAGRPTSLSTGRPYQGVNVILLGLAAAERGYASRWWGTYRQISELGGQVRRGEMSVQVVFWKQLEVGADPGDQARDGDCAHIRTVPLLRAFRVFNAEQADQLPARYRAAETAGPELTGQPQDVLGRYLAAGGPALVHAAGAGPCYDTVRDQITLPAPGQFPSREAYYATAFHEAAHSTGAPSRLNRPGVAGFEHYGSGRYAREELVAEIGGAMLCSTTGVATEASLRDDSAAYIAGWLRALGDDRKLVVTAAAQAERAADRVLEPQRQAEARPGAEADARQPGPAASARARLTAQWAAVARPYLVAEPEAGA
jgi:antirestriction protein ArdC